MQERWPVTTLTGEPAVVTDHRASGVRQLVIAGSVTVAVVAVDQLTKWWAITRLTDGPVHVIGRLDFELSRNTGSAFSLFQGQEAVLVGVAVVLVAVLAVLVWRSTSTSRAAILGLVLGGALGNLSDRIFRGDHGAVVDFVALHFWPTFNVADAAITIGCVLLVVSLLRAPRSP